LKVPSRVFQRALELDPTNSEALYFPGARPPRKAGDSPKAAEIIPPLHRNTFRWARGAEKLKSLVSSLNGVGEMGQGASASSCSANGACRFFRRERNFRCTKTKRPATAVLMLMGFDTHPEFRLVGKFWIPAENRAGCRNSKPPQGVRRACPLVGAGARSGSLAALVAVAYFTPVSRTRTSSKPGLMKF